MRIVALIALAALAGCTGIIEITRPDPPSPVENSKIIDKPRDAVWAAAIPALGKQFFVINTLDKSSGLVNVSYTGDPVNAIDCGQYSSTFPTLSNPQGVMTDKFAAASASQDYRVYLNATYNVTAQVSLEGRTNLLFEEIGPSRTRVTADTRYAVTRHVRVQAANGRGEPLERSDAIAFNTGGGATFPAGFDGQAIQCVARGTLESAILSVIN